MPRVSVVLPTHNRADLLPAALQSVVDQTFSDWELIVVDDASSDSTPEILEDWVARDARIRTVRNDPNRKLPASLNRGFSIATGELWTWTSDDNLLRPQALARMVQELDNHPDAGLVYAGMSLIDEHDQIFAARPAGSPDDVLKEAVVGACFLYRRDLAERVGAYAEDLFLAEDFDYWIRARAVAAFRAIPEDLYLYREHPGALSISRAQRVGEVMAEVLERHLGTPTVAWASASQQAAAHLAVAGQALRQRQRARLRRHVGAAWRLDSRAVRRDFKRGLLVALGAPWSLAGPN